MMTVFRLSDRMRGTRGAFCAAMLAAISCGAGCSDAHLTVRVDSYINNAMQVDAHDQTGQPLNVDVVVLSSADLAREANRDLKPGSGITTDVWYKRRPGATGATPFDIPERQIKSQTLRGKEVPADKKDSYRFADLKMSTLGSKGSCVVYVFPKFIGRGGSLLPVTPAMFNNPSGEIKAFIGVNKDQLSSGPTHGQFVRTE